jgi:hypothetical protein
MNIQVKNLQIYPYFNYNEAFFGGTEYMAKLFHKHIAHKMTKLSKYTCILLPGPFPDSFANMVNDKKEIILWMHNPFYQFEPNLKHLLLDQRFINKIKLIIVVSEFHKKRIMEEINIDESKIKVIYNVSLPIENNIERFNNVEKIKIIHTSSADRGMDLLLRSLKYINLDFELNIYNDFY